MVHSTDLGISGGAGTITKDVTPALQVGYATELVARNKTPEARRNLSFGQQTKILHLLDPQEREALVPGIEVAKAEFWKKWIRFRCGLPDEGPPVFDDVVNMLPVREQFTEFIDPRPGDLIIDLMGGSANMARYIAQREPRIAGYIVIDNNDFALERAQRQLSKVNMPHAGAGAVKNKDTEHYDLSKGLPPDLTDLIGKIVPTRVHYVSNWGMTYVAADDFLRLVGECFDPNKNGGLPSVLDFNMITEGSFNPQVLAEKFRKEVVPHALWPPWHLRIGDLRRAKKATPEIQEFGRELPLVEPIWFPEEMQTLLKEQGFIIERRNDTLLWGQSTAMKISGKIKAS